MNFSGINEEKINIIREYYNSTIIIRGETIILKGAETELDTLEKIFKELIYVQKRQGEISVKDVRLVLDLIDESSPVNLRENFSKKADELNNVILFKKNERVVAKAL